MAGALTGFDLTLAQVRHCLAILCSGKWCLGNCERAVHEGARVYWERYPVKNGICSHCNLPPYSKEKDPTAP